MESRYSIEAVHRVALICAAFDTSRQAFDLPTLARTCDIPQRTLGRIVDTLVRRDFLLRAPDGLIRLGPRWLCLAKAKSEGINIRDAAARVMRGLRDELDETYILGLKRGDCRLISECLISTQPIRRVSHVGFETPLHVGSGGRAIMSRMSDAEIRDYLSRATMENVGYDTVREPKRILHDIEKARRDGYLTSRAEITRESFSCSAPVLDHSDRIIGSLTITLPIARLTPELERKAIAMAQQGARTISQALGHV